VTLVVDLPTDLPVSDVGGKARGLSALFAAGARVPPGFVVLASALDEALALAGDPSRLLELGPTGTLASEIQSALHRLGPGPVAVRSSGVGEDGEARSFAGIHDTFLSVEGVEDVLASIHRCWLSAFSARARAYRDRAGAAEPPRLAVVVQRMVAAQVAGVAFSCDPVARRRDRVVVEAVAGLGDALVSGRAAPDRAVLDRAGAILALEPAANRAGCLDACLAREVADATTALEARLGFPVDVEWARADDGIHLLQVRPVTTPLHAPSSGVERTVWSNTNLAEVLPGVATPMTFSVAERYVASLIGPVLELFGVDAASFRPVGLVAGRMYVNVNAVMAWLRALPGMRRRRPVDLARLMGGDEKGLAEAVAKLDPEDLPTARLSAWRVLRGAWRLTRAILRNHRADGGGAVSELRAETDREAAIDVAILDDAALVARLDHLSRSPFGATRALEGVSSAIVGMLCAGGLPVLTHRWLGDRSLGMRLLQGIGGLDSADAGLALLELGRLARGGGVGELEGAFPQVEARLGNTPEGRRFLAAFSEFLRRHGHHCRAESDVSVPRWAEDPEYVLGQVRGAALHDEERVAAAMERGRARGELIEELRRRLGPVRKRIVFAVLERAARGAAARENGRSEATRRVFLVRQALLEAGRRLERRGIVRERGDVFFLVLEEIGPALRGASMHAIIAERRRAHARHLALSPPPVVVGEYEPAEPGSESPSAPPSDTVLRGIAASPGIIEGPARVVLREDAEETVRPGEILVAPFTDPGWTPYLVGAAGVVMDFGGMLSHGSVVAREYGIPAVVNVGTGTSRIRTGELVRVDGTRGVVELLGRVPAS